MTTTPPTAPTVADTLARGDRCVLAVRGGSWPVVVPTVFWSDGGGVWMTAAAGSAAVRALRRHPHCALWVPAPGGPAGGNGAEPGVVVHGRARVFGLRDPVGLAFHGVTVSTAMTALAVKQAAAVLGYVRDATRAVPRLVRRCQVVTRVGIDDARPAGRPVAAPGVAPALPVVVSADVRRALAGERRVVVATQGRHGLTLVPAVWSSGFAIEPRPVREAASAGAPGGIAATVAVDVPPPRRPTEAVGLVLAGTLDGRGRLDASRAIWWHGLRSASATIPSVAGVTLPD